MRQFIVVSLLVIVSPFLHAQQLPPGSPIFGGVYIDGEGVVKFRETDAKGKLNSLRTAAKNTQEKLVFISIPRLFAEARAAIDSGKPVPDELRYLGGLTQIQYVIADPAARDLFVAGPAESWDAANPLQPVGKLTGRPVMHLDDLVVAMRTAAQSGRQPLGCTIDPDPNTMQRAQDVTRQYASRSRRELVAAMSEALGPQKVTVFGAAADTRLAMICVAADYRLKRYVLGIENPPVSGIGHAVDNTRAAGNRYWFEPSYEPLLVSTDGNIYELRGPRLQLKAGALPFEEKGATPKAINFTKNFTQKIPALAGAVPLFADLQNVADAIVFATLLRHDKLAQRVGWDASWAMSTSALPISKVPVPQTADTLVNITSGSLAAGGVNLSAGALVSGKRQMQGSGDQTAILRRLEQARSSEGPIFKDQ